MNRTMIAVVSMVGLALPAGSAHAAVADAPAAPVEVMATNGMSSISLTWTAPPGGSRAVGFRVYEGTSVVARNTTTHVTVYNLGFSSTHTYTVRAVDAAGVESVPSDPVTRRVWVGGAVPPCSAAVPTDLTASSVTASSISLTWVPASTNLATGPVQVFEGDLALTQSLTRGAHLGGLAPGSTHVLRLGLSCMGGSFLFGPPITVTTLDGPAARPDAATAVAVTSVTTDSASLSWASASRSQDPVVGYVVYEGATPVATTTGGGATITGLYRDTTHSYSVFSLDAAGNQSAASKSVSAQLPTCEVRPPAPVVAAAANSRSTVVLAWAEASAASGYTVFEGSTAVATTVVPSAVVSGLASRSTHHFTVQATLVSGCGVTPVGAAPTVMTLPGSPARPSAPTNLVLSAGHPINTATGSVTFTWVEPASSDRVARYALYEGATVVATTTTPTVTLTLPSAASHQYTVSAIDKNGGESAQSAPVTFSVPFNPIP